MVFGCSTGACLDGLLAQENTSQQPSIHWQEVRSKLEQAVDAPRSTDRRRLADELSANKDVEIEDWLKLMRDFGRFEAEATGPKRIRISLPVGDRIEDTELYLFVPGGYSPQQAAPLMAAFHGTGGIGRGVESMWRRQAEELGMLVVAPSEAGPNEGYAFSERERLAAMAAIRWMRRRYNVDEDRIYLSGVSRGGHLTWDLALRYPDRFAALAPMIGGPYLNLQGGKNNLRYLENIRDIPIRDLQGSQDQPALLFNLRYAFAKLKTYGAAKADLIEFPNHGHSFEFQAVHWPDFLGDSRRRITPNVVIRTVARESQGRAFWVDVLSYHRDVKEEFTPKVPHEEWNRMSPDQQKSRYMDEVMKRTGRIEVEMTEPGRFIAESRGIRSFRLLLTEDMVDAKRRVEVKHGKKTTKKRLRPDIRLLLREFVERFDRKFLPVYHLKI